MNCEEKGITIELSPSFKKAFKKLAKRYKSLVFDFDKFILSIQRNPIQGVDLGGGLRKIRLAISSKGKGKSAGARVISCTLKLSKSGQLYLLTIYDKSEKESISDAELGMLIKEID